ncbi:carbohydrate ABC transporter permease [Arthrobacter sp. FW306-05-C]|uniref:carbohydrate ABC transporter permease n=1 Tax=unclassified Arthrobacter TaxID=235627 RepID=UPI001EF044E3|nr:MULTISPECIES: carbohydrate ABC transporter permease [unclassified Arthrobacter]UKA66169.1 carbohydrate ABC transporter permease [Arthrobacter sp. FW306-05-C]UKA70518.1 carbohydrate ABC transporter permease [Arthrobacter sp. FW306-06-A]UKA74821.1 carbohydrate ABC transporter permease [Arthrobacter sp. FW306-07-I]
MTTAKVSAPARATARRRTFTWRRGGAWLLVALAVAVSVLPFYWILRTALSTNGALAGNATNLLPADFNLGAFQRVFGLQSPEEAVAQGGSGAQIDFWIYLRNSVLFASITTTGAVFFSAMAAYAFARLRWRGRNLVFSLFLATMMVPPIFTALPNFLLIKNLGLLNTMVGLVLPYIFMTPFAIFFLRQFFLNMSREVEEAAMLDGAKHLRIFFQIILPNAAAPIATLALLTFIGQWNEYFWPLLVGQDESVRVLTVGLGVFKSQSPQGAPDWSGLMAATLVSALPVLILFAIFGKKIVNSIGFSGIK